MLCIVGMLARGLVSNHPLQKVYPLCLSIKANSCSYIACHAFSCFQVWVGVGGWVSGCVWVRGDRQTDRDRDRDRARENVKRVSDGMC